MDGWLDGGREGGKEGRTEGLLLLWKLNLNSGSESS